MKYTELLPRIQEIGGKLSRGGAKNPALRLNPPHLLPYCLPLPSCHRFRPASHRLIPVTPILSPLPCSSPVMPPFPVPPFPIPFPTHLRFRPAFPRPAPVLPPISAQPFPNLLTLPRPRPSPFPAYRRSSSPTFSAAVLHRSRPILRPGLPAPRPAILFPTATICPSFPCAHKRAHKKRTAGVTPAVISIYRRTAAPSLRAGITPRPSLLWQLSWRSSPRQPPWRSSARPDLRCRPASSSRPKR